jgi:hypothetical protein
MRKLGLSAAGLLLLAACLAPEARAQYSTAPMPGWYDHGVARQQTLNGWRVKDKLRQQRGRQTRQTPPSSRPAPGSPQTKPAPQTTTPSGDTTFVPAGHNILPPRLAANTPAHRQEAERFYGQLLDAYAAMARRKGVPTNDVARAASFAISSLYYVHRGGEDLSNDQLEALRAQMRELFSEDEQFQRLSARGRQELYESYVIQGMAVSSVYDGARQQGDRRKADEMQAAARQSLRELLGVPADQISITSNGVEFR